MLGLKQISAVFNRKRKKTKHQSIQNIQALVNVLFDSTWVLRTLYNESVFIGGFKTQRATLFSWSHFNPLGLMAVLAYPNDIVSLRWHSSTRRVTGVSNTSPKCGLETTRQFLNCWYTYRVIINSWRHALFCTLSSHWCERHAGS